MSGTDNNTFIGHVDMLNYAEKGGQINVYNSSKKLPEIRMGALPACHPFIESGQRAQDLESLEILICGESFKQSDTNINVDGTGQSIWLYGEGGMGKTELALRFAEKHPEYSYIQATYKGSINQTISQNLFYLDGYKMLGKELNDIQRHEQNMRAFAAYGRKLVLIIDNYEPDHYEKAFQEMTEHTVFNGQSVEENDLKSIDNLLRNKIHVILTTRMTPSHCEAYHAIEVTPMKEDDLLKLMIDTFPWFKDHLDDVSVIGMLKDLIRIAEHNTIIVSLLANAIKASDKHPMEALSLLYNSMTNSSDIESRFPEEEFFSKYSQSTIRMLSHLGNVFRFIDLSWQDKRILRILALLPPEGMDLELYKKLTFSSVEQINARRDDTVRRFIDNHIVVTNSVNGNMDTSQSQTKNELTVSKFKFTICMHSLMSDYVLWMLQNEENLPLSTIVSVYWIQNLLNYFSDEKLKNLTPTDTEYSNISTIARACATTACKLEKGESAYVHRYRLLIKAAELSLKVGNVKDALEYVERAIAVDGASSNDIFAMYNTSYRIGSLLYDVAKYKDALFYYKQALRIKDDSNGFYPLDKDLNQYDIETILSNDDGNDYGVLFSSIGSIYQKVGDYNCAKDYKLKALELLKTVYSPNDYRLAILYDNIGLAYWDLGDLYNALYYQNKACEIFQQVKPPRPVDLALSYGNLGLSHYKLHDYHKAIDYIIKSISLAKKVFPPDHYFYANIYDNLASCFAELGEFENALKYHFLALEISQKNLPANHPDLIINYINIGATYTKLGDLDSALNYLLVAAETEKKQPNLSSSSRANIYDYLSIVYGKLNDHKTATEYKIKSRLIRRIQS